MLPLHHIQILVPRQDSNAALPAFTRAYFPLYYSNFSPYLHCLTLWYCVTYLRFHAFRRQVLSEIAAAFPIL